MKKVNSFQKLGCLISGSLHLINICMASGQSDCSKRNVLVDQIIDSVIVGGITGVSTYVAAGETISINSAILAFTLTFLIKMKEYRKIK